jgi:thioredoxin 1
MHVRESNIGVVTDSTFAEVVLPSKKPVLVEFVTAGCDRCRSLVPTLEEIANVHRDTLAVVKLDVDQNPTTVAAYAVTATPTMILFVDGKTVKHIAEPLRKPALLMELKSYLRPAPTTS